MSKVENERLQQAKDQLVVDFRAVVTDAEELLRATAGEVGGTASIARAKIEASLRNARSKLADIEATLTNQARDAAQAADAMVHEHPWKAVGVAAAVGFVLGLLIQRR